MQPDRRRLLHKVVTDATDRIVTHNSDICADANLVCAEIVISSQSNGTFTRLII